MCMLLIGGNTDCWLGLLEFVCKNVKDPQNKLVKRWNKRARQFGTACISFKEMQKCIAKWCGVCGVKQPEANNTWARKSFVTTGLHD